MAITYFYSICIFVGILYTGHGFSVDDDGPVQIDISDGTIAGRVAQESGNTFYAFQEIPYAAPPVGELRFMKPQPPAKWEGILNTTENNKICVDVDLIYLNTDPRQTEDCLYLNVYTPVDPRQEISELLPVLFWIHGGGFESGAGTYDYYGPAFFMGYDIILVSINYRLGPFGFLTTNDGVIPGNVGIRDQQFALQWVQDNIKYFGGDPTKVTIMGQSAGSSLVGYHLLSEKSKGLYRAAIMESGSPLACWSLQKYPRDAAYILGQTISSNINSQNSSQELLTELQSMPWSVLKRFSEILSPLEKHNCYDGFYLTWTPISEDESLQDTVIGGLLHEDIKTGRANRVPLMIGFTSQEILGFGIDIPEIESILLNLNHANAVNKNLNMASENRPAAGNAMTEVYTNGSFIMSLASAAMFLSDVIMTTPISRHASLQSQYSDVYLYQFSYKGKLGELSCNLTLEGAEGACHSEEIEYMFGRANGNQDINNFPESDVLTHKRLMELWTGFVKTTNPTSQKLDMLQNITWPKVTPDQLSYLDIDSDLTIKVDPKKYQEWRQIIEEYADDELMTY